MNASGGLDHDSVARGASPPVLSSIGVAAPPPRGNLAIVAIGSLVVVAAVLGWRWMHRPVIAVVAAAPAAVVPSPPSTATLEVTVLEVKTVPPPAPSVVPVVEPPPTPVPPSPTNRTLVRTKKPTRPTGGRSEAVEARPVEHLEPAPVATKPDPQKPAIEANPYLYK